MAYTTSGLVDLLRSELGDIEFPGQGDDSESLWSNAELKDYLAQAQVELVKRVDLLPDSTSYTLALTADEPFADVDANIVRIRWGRIAALNRKLTSKTLREIEQSYLSDDYGIQLTDNWEDLTGEPIYMVTDMDVGKVRLVPIPAEDATVALYTYRFPKTSPRNDADPEIPDEFRRGLAFYCKFLAYQKNDIETRNDDRASDNLDLWNEFVVQTKSEISRKQRGPQTTQYGGIPMDSYYWG